VREEHKVNMIKI